MDATPTVAWCQWAPTRIRFHFVLVNDMPILRARRYERRDATLPEWRLLRARSALAITVTKNLWSRIRLRGPTPLPPGTTAPPM